MNIGIILAGGIGSRFKNKTNKSLIDIVGKPSILRVMETYENHTMINGIVVVINKDIEKEFKKIISQEEFKKIKNIVLGGDSRQESTRIGLNACEKLNAEKVLIQEAVRPMTTTKVISDTIKALDDFVGTVAVFPNADAIIKFNEKKVIEEIPDKSFLGKGQSPEGFQFKAIKKAHYLARKENFTQVSENCALILKYNIGQMQVIEGEVDSLKITYPMDADIISKIIEVKEKQ